MDAAALQALVKSRFARSSLPEPEFAVGDAQTIERHFGCTLPESFAPFRALIGVYRICGGHETAEELIAIAETEPDDHPYWDADFLPFVVIGNGDYLCLRRSECPDSAVYYVAHDAPTERAHASFDDYLRDPVWHNGFMVRRVDSLDGERLESLCALLADCVESGASIGFLAPLRPETAREYWQGVKEALGPHLALFVAEEDGRAVGAVQLALCAKENGRHRAEIQKLMVHRAARGRGVASRLMATAETFAREAGRTLLVLDTGAGSPAEAVYRHLGWERVGEVPGYALGTDGIPHTTAYYYKRLE